MQTKRPWVRPFSTRSSRSGLGWSLFASVGVALAPSLAQAAPRVPTHVACVGDSITYGYLASNPATKSYPAVLQGLFGASVQVKNFGHSGATLLSAPYGDLPYEDQAEYAAATSFVSGAGASSVVDVIIMLGTNDSKSYNWAPSGKPKNDQQFLSDYRALVEHFVGLTSKPQVFLALPLATGNNPCCSIDGAVIHDQIMPLIRQLAKEKNLPTIDLNTPTANHPEYFSDGVHPTDAGYALVANLMHDGLLVEQSSGGASGGGGVGGAAGSGVGASSGGGVGGAAGSGGSASSAGGSGGIGASAMGGAGSAGASMSSAGASSGGAAGAGALGGANAGTGTSAAGSSPGSGGAGNSVTGSPASASASDSGCALASHAPRSRAIFLLGVLGSAGWLVRRRRPRC